METHQDIYLPIFHYPVSHWTTHSQFSIFYQILWYKNPMIHYHGGTNVLVETH
jgi:hypothetical protein